jgi:Leucine-rich repeat (LRR) protein
MTPDDSVTELKLSFKGLTKLPDDIHLYKNLKILDCGNNRLTALPENLPAFLKTLVFFFKSIYNRIQL